MVAMGEADSEVAMEEDENHELAESSRAHVATPGEGDLRTDVLMEESSHDLVAILVTNPDFERQVLVPRR